MSADFEATKDVADRIATALIALVHGDDAGAALALDRTNIELAQQTFVALLTLTAHFGCLAMGPENFVAEMANWRDAMAALPSDWWEKKQRGEQ